MLGQLPNCLQTVSITCLPSTSERASGEQHCHLQMKKPQLGITQLGSCGLQSVPPAFIKAYSKGGTGRHVCPYTQSRRVKDRGRWVPDPLLKRNRSPRPWATRSIGIYIWGGVKTHTTYVYFKSVAHICLFE